MIITNNNEKISFRNLYKNSSAFLILGGPSLNKLLNSSETISIDGNKRISCSDALNLPGFITMGVNNSVKSFRPNIWTSVDEPSRFIKSIWFDPKIQKFIPYEYMDKQIFDNEEWKDLNMSVRDCPNVYGIERNEKFNHNTFLTESTFNWGNHKNYGGGRSVMLVAIKLLYYLGIKNIFLLGCDFKMATDYTYSFEQSRTQGAINNNNRTYQMMKERFELLKPIFEQNNLSIYNCNPESELKVFEFISFEDAIKKAYGEKLPKDLINERTKDMYSKNNIVIKQETNPNKLYKSKIPRLL